MSLFNPDQVSACTECGVEDFLPSCCEYCDKTFCRTHLFKHKDCSMGENENKIVDPANLPAGGASLDQVFNQTMEQEQKAKERRLQVERQQQQERQQVAAASASSSSSSAPSHFGNRFKQTTVGTLGSSVPPGLSRFKRIEVGVRDTLNVAHVCLYFAFLEKKTRREREATSEGNQKEEEKEQGEGEEDSELFLLRNLMIDCNHQVSLGALVEKMRELLANKYLVDSLKANKEEKSSGGISWQVDFKKSFSSSSSANSTSTVASVLSQGLIPISNERHNALINIFELKPNNKQQDSVVEAFCLKPDEDQPRDKFNVEKIESLSSTFTGSNVVVVVLSPTPGAAAGLTTTRIHSCLENEWKLRSLHMLFLAALEEAKRLKKKKEQEEKEEEEQQKLEQEEKSKCEKEKAQKGEGEREASTAQEGEVVPRVPLKLIPWSATSTFKALSVAVYTNNTGSHSKTKMEDQLLVILFFMDAEGDIAAGTHGYTVRINSSWIIPRLADAISDTKELAFPACIDRKKPLRLSSLLTGQPLDQKKTLKELGFSNADGIVVSQDTDGQKKLLHPHREEAKEFKGFRETKKIPKELAVRNMKECTIQ